MIVVNFDFLENYLREKYWVLNLKDGLNKNVCIVFFLEFIYGMVMFLGSEIIINFYNK